MESQNGMMRNSTPRAFAAQRLKHYGETLDEFRYLLAREAHWPATIAELYDREKMPDDLRAAHDRNDLALERIYIGRRFNNDTQRLETLFQMYTEMTAKEKANA